MVRYRYHVTTEEHHIIRLSISKRLSGGLTSRLCPWSATSAVDIAGRLGASCMAGLFWECPSSMEKMPSDLISGPCLAQDCTWKRVVVREVRIFSLAADQKIDHEDAAKKPERVTSFLGGCFLYSTGAFPLDMLSIALSMRPSLSLMTPRSKAMKTREHKRITTADAANVPAILPALFARSSGWCSYCIVLAALWY